MSSFSLFWEGLALGSLLSFALSATLPILWMKLLSGGSTSMIMALEWEFSYSDQLLDSLLLQFWAGITLKTTKDITASIISRPSLSWELFLSGFFFPGFQLLNNLSWILRSSISGRLHLLTSSTPWAPAPLPHLLLLFSSVEKFQFTTSSFPAFQ